MVAPDIEDDAVIAKKVRAPVATLDVFRGSPDGLLGFVKPCLKRAFHIYVSAPKLYKLISTQYPHCNSLFPKWEFLWKSGILVQDKIDGFPYFRCRIDDLDLFVRFHAHHPNDRRQERIEETVRCRFDIGKIHQKTLIFSTTTKSRCIGSKRSFAS